MPLFAVLLLAPTTLSAFLKAHPPAGPWLALDAENVVSEKAADLDDFDRKAVKVGGITAIVPRTMVVFADPSKETPNLAEGLPREDKLLALLATLDDWQWRTLSAAGLSSGDLREEQRPIFDSIIPRPLRWRSTRREEAKTVPDKDAGAARIKVNRRVVFAIGIGRDPRNYTLMDASYGGPIPYSGSLVEDRDSQFGVRLRRREPNVLKKGGLLDFPGVVVVQKGETVTSLLALVSRATNREILADRRVGVLKVTLPPGSYRVGDLTQALALTTTGTFRKVGSAFVLAADLEGALPRWERLSAWITGLRREATSQRLDWQAKIAASGGIRRVGYDAKDPIAPPAEFGETMRPIGSPNLQSAGTLPPVFQKEIEGMQKEMPERDIDPSRVEARYETVATLVLPTGESLSLGGVRTELSPSASPPLDRVVRSSATTPRSRVREGASLSVVADDRPSLETAIRLAEEYGFGELWLETSNAEALRFAIETSGRPVRWVVRPWTAFNGAKLADPDLSGAGFRAKDIEGVTPTQRDLISPFDPSRGPRLDALAQLAKTPGLKGVVVLDPTPTGYDVGSSDRRLPTNPIQFGYSGAARLAFLRQEGLDPIDIASQWIGTSQSLSRPFFSYGQDLGTPTRTETEAFQKDRTAWATFRTEANIRETRSMLERFGEVPILVEARSAFPSELRLALTLKPYDPSKPLAVDGPPNPDSVRLVRLYADQSSIRLGRRQAVDLSHVPTRRWISLLGALFLKAGNQ